MLIKWILLKTVEKRNLHSLLLSQTVQRIVSLLIIEFDFFNNLSHLRLIFQMHLPKNGLVVNPLRFYWIELVDECVSPVEFVLTLIYLTRSWLFEQMLSWVIKFSHSCFTAEHKVIQNQTNILDRSLFIHLIQEALSNFVSIVSVVQIVIHKFNSWLHPLVVLFGSIFLIFKLFGRYLHLREFGV